ncbi:unnamed protein product, partial [Vitis vinifera]|uniref:Uncharacterized protein n=1 Tax=Vitis vinifera TaxID=29760 RepID=D7TFB2_VITVI
MMGFTSLANYSTRKFYPISLFLVIKTRLTGSLGYHKDIYMLLAQDERRMIERYV